MSPEIWTTLAATVAGTVLLIRILTLGRARGWSGLTVYLSQHILWGYALLAIPRSNRLYLRLYEISNPVEWVAAIVCVMDLLGRAFGAYPGIRSLSRWAACGATIAATAIALTLARFFWSGSARGQKVLFYFEVVDRSVLLSLALIVVLTLAFLSRYPLPLTVNTWISLIAFSAILLSLASARLIDSLAPGLASQAADAAQLVFECVCYALWAGLLQKRETESPERVIFHHVGEQELLRQLDAMNGILRGAGRS